MPTPVPTAVENETVRLLTPPRRIDFTPLPAGDLLRPIQAGYQSTGVVDHRLQLVVFNDLDGIKADALILAARLQEADVPKPVLNLWYDSALLASQALYDFADYRRVSQGVPERVKEQYLKYVLREVRFAMMENSFAWPEGITDYLATSSHFSPDEFHWLEGHALPQLLQARENQRGLLNYIKDQLTGFTVNEYDIRSTGLPADVRPTDHWYERFNQYAFVKDDLPLAQDLLLMHIEDQGGFIVEGKKPPAELKETVFPPDILDSLSDSEKLLGQLAEQQVVQEKLSEVYGNEWQAASRRQLQAIENHEGTLYKGNYIHEIEQLNPALAGRLQQTTPDRPASIRDFFKHEGWLVESSQGVRQVNPEGLGRPPRVYLTEQHAPAVRRMADDASKILAFIDEYSLELEKIRSNPAVNSFAKESRTEGALNAEFFGGEFINSVGKPDSVPETDSIVAQFIEQQFVNRNSKFNRRYLGFHDRLSTLVRLSANSLSNQNIDLKGDIAGPGALSRLLPEGRRSVLSDGRSLSLPVFDDNRFGLTLPSTPSQAEILDAHTPRWVNTREYDSLIILQIGDDAVLASAARQIYQDQKDSKSVYWGRVEIAQEAILAGRPKVNGLVERGLINIENSPFTADRRTELRLVFHGSPEGKYFGGDLNAVQLGSLIEREFYAELSGERRFLSDIVCSSCNLLQPSKHLFEWIPDDKGTGQFRHRESESNQAEIIGKPKPVLLLEELQSRSITSLRGMRVYSKKVVMVAGVLFLAERDLATNELTLTSQPDSVTDFALFEQRVGTQAELSRIVDALPLQIRLEREAGENKPVILTVLDHPEGIVPSTIAFTNYRTEPLASGRSNIRGIDVEFSVPGVELASPGYRRLVDRLSASLSSGDILVHADLTALLLGMEAENTSHNIVVVDPSTTNVAGFLATLDLAARSESADEFIWRVKQHFSQSKGDSLNNGMSRFPDKDAAFERLKNNILGDELFRFNTADITTRRGSGFVNENFREKLSVVYTDLFDASGCGGGGNRRRRLACSPEEIEEQAREASDGLTLLSDDETRIIVGSSADDIALHTSEPDTVLAKV